MKKLKNLVIGGLAGVPFPPPRGPSPNGNP